MTIDLRGVTLAEFERVFKKHRLTFSFSAKEQASEGLILDNLACRGIFESDAFQEFVTKFQQALLVLQCDRFYLETVVCENCRYFGMKIFEGEELVDILCAPTLHALYSELRSYIMTGAP